MHRYICTYLYVRMFAYVYLPPAPWSCMDTMGLFSPRSIHALITRFILFSISASPRCTASKSSAKSSSLPTLYVCTCTLLASRASEYIYVCTWTCMSYFLMASMKQRHHPCLCDNMVHLSYIQPSLPPADIRIYVCICVCMSVRTYVYIYKCVLIYSQAGP